MLFFWQDRKCERGENSFFVLLWLDYQLGLARGDTSI